MKNRNWILLPLILIIGCTTGIISFDGGIKEMENINEKYNVDYKSFPVTVEDSARMLRDMKSLEISSAPESFKLFLDYRIKASEAHLVHLEAWKHGMRGSTRKGFGCKGLPIVVNSSILRNASAQRGYISIDLLQEFLDKYPEEAESINMTQRDITFSNAYYYEVEQEARRDRRIIERFCGDKQ